MSNKWKLISTKLETNYNIEKYTRNKTYTFKKKKTIIFL